MPVNLFPTAIWPSRWCSALELMAKVRKNPASCSWPTGFYGYLIENGLFRHSLGRGFVLSDGIVRTHADALLTADAG